MFCSLHDLVRTLRLMNYIDLVFRCKLLQLIIAECPFNANLYGQVTGYLFRSDVIVFYDRNGYP